MAGAGRAVSNKWMAGEAVEKDRWAGNYSSNSIKRATAAEKSEAVKLTHPQRRISLMIKRPMAPTL